MNFTPEPEPSQPGTKQQQTGTGPWPEGWGPLV